VTRRIGGQVTLTDKEILKKISELRGLAEHARALALSLPDAEGRDKVLRSAAELERQATELESGGAPALPAGALPEANAMTAGDAIAALAAPQPGTEAGGDKR
jgi:hypothetical protein